MPSYCYFLLFVIFCLSFGDLNAQSSDAGQDVITLSGQVFDAETGEPLPAASVQLKGTFRGSITNSEGFFELRFNPDDVSGSDEGVYTLIVRFIGYKPQEVPFRKGGLRKTIELEPAPQELDELVFTGEDPALHIMERVIARKQIWRAELESWRAEAYTRNTLANADSLVSITESLTEVWWQRGEGFQEYVVDQQQTRNLMSDQNFAGFRNLPNFYDDEIEIAGFRMIGVTHPEALRFYDFRIAGERGEGSELVYEIEVSPATRLQPSFEGRISVLAEEYALLDVDLKPAEMVFFPPPVQEADVRYKQQFSNYGEDFWLPVDVRVNGRVRVGFPGLQFPEFRLNLVSAITKYDVNIAVPDSVFGAGSPDDFRLTRLSEEQRLQAGRSLDGEQSARSIPLNEEESEAFASIDSTQSIQDAFQPTGLLSSFVSNGGDGESGEPPSGFRARLSLSPQLHFNRVEALYGGIRPEFRLTRGLRLRGLLGLASSNSELSYGGGFRYRSPVLAESSNGRPRVLLEGSYRHDVRSRIPSYIYPRLLTSAAMLSGGADYHDYYKRERFELKTGMFFNDGILSGRRLRGSIALATEEQRSLHARSSYSFAGGVQQRANPAIEEGRLNSLSLALGTAGTPVEFGFAGSNTALFQIEYADEALLGGDFRFTRYEGRLDLRFNTFLKRRFLPNTLDMRLQGFTHSGGLPVQRFGGFDGKAVGISAFGGFKTLLNRMMEGEQGAAVFWEHNFRTVPLELLGLRGLAESGLGFLVHGASGRTWLSESGRAALSASAPDASFLRFNPVTGEEWRHELGVSLNGIFSLLRIDATWRVDRPGFYAGISAARVF
jgi:hypothetical protein